MISLNLTTTFSVATLLIAVSSAADVGASPQQPWSGGADSGGQQGGATCTNCTICPYSCRGQPQAPPVPPQVPGFGGYAPPGAGNCPPGTTPACCQQQNPNNPNPNNPNPNFNYYYSPPYSLPYNGNELRKPFLDGLAGFLMLVFVALYIMGF